MTNTTTTTTAQHQRNARQQALRMATQTTTDPVAAMTSAEHWARHTGRRVAVSQDQTGRLALGVRPASIALVGVATPSR